MDFQYTINQIASRCKVSITSINNLKKKNQDFINKNSMRRQHKIYYNQAAMNFFLSYYSADTEKKIPDKIIDTDTAEAQAKNPPSEASYTDKPHESQLDELKAEIEALQTEIGALRKQLEIKEAERLELLRQNGALILTLQQEKQEKMLLLPAPKKTLSERVKGFFKVKPQEK